MPGMRDIKRRIKSVKSTQQITRAMKMVAAAKLRKSQDRLMQYRPFSDAHQNMVGRVMASIDEVSHPLFSANESGAKLLLIITSDKGLCGGFNTGIIRMIEDRIKGEDKDTVQLYPIGRKGWDYFRKRGYTIWKGRQMSGKEDPFAVAQEVGDEIITAFTNGEFSSVDIAYVGFQSALVQHNTIKNLIPMEQVSFDEEYPQEYAFEPTAEEVMEILLPLSIKLTIFRSYLETNTAEHGARMTAMDSATNNAVEMIASLTLSYNKARQAAITKELIEVVSGADALE